MRPAIGTPLALSLVLTVLAACGSPSGNAAPDAAEAATAAVPAVAPAASPSRIRIQGLGLDITDAAGTTSTLKFEQVSQADAIAAVNAATGTTPEVTTNNDCPSGPTSFADYPNGLQLVFVDGSFQGWTLDQAGIYTENEFGVGVDRATMDSLPDFQIDTSSTLGVEFYFQGVNGFMSSDAPDGVVESLYAGLTCFFR
ncbi:hypothetical protein MMB232_02212 [Brevundimonas subvibrioides]|uniref:hypothetical protein n=1 Tax=Brevundimonas subvibrioides TaxID=74313 RepID=UPI0032D58160